jgi:hypothetical protein
MLDEERWRDSVVISKADELRKGWRLPRWHDESAFTHARFDDVWRSVVSRIAYHADGPASGLAKDLLCARERACNGLGDQQFEAAVVSTSSASVGA